MSIERKAIAASTRLSPNAVALAIANSGVRAEDFGSPVERSLWECVQRLALGGKKSTDIEILELAQGCAPVRLGGGTAVVLEVLRTPPELALPELLARVREAGKLRRAVVRLAEATEVATSPGATSTGVRDTLSKALRGLAEDSGGVRTSEGVCSEIIDDLERVSLGKKEPVLATGLDAWDGVLGGLQPTLTVIGAMPGVGKSALLAGIVRNLGARGVRTGFFSLEDEKKWVANRLLSFYSRVPLQTMLFRPIDKSEFSAVSDAMSTVHNILSNTIIDDRQGLDCRDVVAMADAMVADGARAIIVDHLGEIRIKSRERHDLEITEVCSDLRGIAKRHGVPVVLACHLKRNGNEDEQSVPRLTDFAFSSGIERTCRVGLGLSRVVDEKSKAPIPGVIRVHVLKQTNGIGRGVFDLEIDQPSAVVKNTPAPQVASRVSELYPRNWP